MSTTEVLVEDETFMDLKKLSTRIEVFDLYDDVGEKKKTELKEIKEMGERDTKYIVCKQKETPWSFKRQTYSRFWKKPVWLAIW